MLVAVIVPLVVGLAESPMMRVLPGTAMSASVGDPVGPNWRPAVTVTFA